MDRRELKQIRVVSPCPMQWEEMRGDNRARFCEKCQKQVHNLSEMTAEEASVLFSGPTTPCVQYEPDAKGSPRFRDDRYRGFARLIAVVAGCLAVVTARPSNWPDAVAKARLLLSHGEKRQLTSPIKLGEVVRPPILGKVKLETVLGRPRISKGADQKCPPKRP